MVSFDELIKDDLAAAEARGEVRGKALGIKKGEITGTVRILSSLIKDGFLSLPEAASRAGMNESVCIEHMHQLGL